MQHVLGVGSVLHQHALGDLDGQAAAIQAGFAQREIDYILSIGGIEVHAGVTLGQDITITRLRDEYSAVFLGVGLSSVNWLGIEGEDLPGVENAVEYIAELRQASDKGDLPVGRRVVVIGGGMTAHTNLPGFH